MILDPQDAAIFFRLYIPLLGFVKKQVKHIPGLKEAEETTQVLFCVREIMCKNPQLIQKYADTNPEKLRPRELAIIKSWERFVHGQFVCISAGKKDATLLRWEGRTKIKAYHVLGITDPIAAIASARMLLRNILLLPWENRIIWDGIVPGGNIFIGPNMWRGVKEDYQKCKETHNVMNAL